MLRFRWPTRSVPSLIKRYLIVQRINRHRIRACLTWRSSRITSRVRHSGLPISGEHRRRLRFREVSDSTRNNLVRLHTTQALIHCSAGGLTMSRARPWSITASGSFAWLLKRIPGHHDLDIHGVLPLLLYSPAEEHDPNQACRADVDGIIFTATTLRIPRRFRPAKLRHSQMPRGCLVLVGNTVVCRSRRGANSELGNGVVEGFLPSCRNGAGPTAFTGNQATVVLLDPAFRAPLDWRANIGLTRTSLAQLVHRAVVG